MKDERGIYYQPSMQEPDVRMYVRRGETTIEFRLHNPQHPEIWERHLWVPYDAIKKAAEMYKEKSKGERNPLALYDLNVAERLLHDEGQ